MGEFRFWISLDGSIVAFHLLYPHHGLCIYQYQSTTLLFVSPLLYHCEVHRRDREFPKRNWMFVARRVPEAVPLSETPLGNSD